MGIRNVPYDTHVFDIAISLNKEKQKLKNGMTTSHRDESSIQYVIQTPTFRVLGVCCNLVAGTNYVMVFTNYFWYLLVIFAAGTVARVHESFLQKCKLWGGDYPNE